MTSKVTAPIPKENWNTWYGLFKHSGGRLLFNPIFSGQTVWVDYTFDDHEQEKVFNNKYRLLTTQIVENKRPWWRKLLRIIKVD